jgi:hypothetical protein
MEKRVRSEESEVRASEVGKKDGIGEQKDYHESTKGGKEIRRERREKRERIVPEDRRRRTDDRKSGDVREIWTFLTALNAGRLGSWEAGKEGRRQRKWGKKRSEIRSQPFDKLRVNREMTAVRSKE